MAAARAQEMQEDGDELLFGDFCFSCGNATQGGPYCSPACRKADLERSEASPDDSPFLSAIPPLISSAKSTCSTPPSSAANSPVHINNGGLDLGEPPALDLPPPKHGIEYGGQSLPHGLRFPSTWTINYQPDLLSSPLVQSNDVQQAKDLRYRRKPGKPQSVVPSPLYFRQKAAARHGSPGFGATSVFNPSMSGLPASTDVSGAHIHEDDIASLDLPGQRHADSVSHLLPKPAHCGRAGCVGVPKRPKLEQQRSSGRRVSGSMSPALRGLAPLDTSDDLLLSPRIRSLRLNHSPSDPREVSPLASPADGNASAPKEDEHSAFACYLFSHLSTEAPPEEERGRTSMVNHAAPELLRSRSVDTVLAARHAVHTTANSASPAPAASRPRGMMGGRNAAVNMRSEPAIETATRGRRRSPSPAAVPTADKDDTSLFTANGAELDRDATVRAPNQRGRDRHRMQLTPGHFISATSETPSGVSPFRSPPPSPPTAGRGRSVTRRMSDAEPVASVDPRGRSKMRGAGAVQRSQSPSARKNSLSPSRSRSQSRSRSKTRSPSRGRVNGLRDARTSRESSGTSGRRGRTRERAGDVSPVAPLANGFTRAANAVPAANDSDEEEAGGSYGEREERGRGRSRQVDSRSRSRSKYRRSNGREIVF
ncbi:hypothetical protein JCM10908_001210 [Rhodotorula pacifica]|uniref:uncharacterized protein n=1 Tax=Rhodotorula pacifica TaxID=1495444 RepID=UPI00316E7CAF